MLCADKAREMTEERCAVLYTDARQKMEELILASIEIGEKSLIIYRSDLLEVLGTRNGEVISNLMKAMEGHGYRVTRELMQYTVAWGE